MTRFAKFLESVDPGVLVPSTLRAPDGRMCILGAAYDACGGDWSKVESPTSQIHRQHEVVPVLTSCYALTPSHLSAIEMAFDGEIIDRIRTILGEEAVDGYVEAFDRLTPKEKGEVVQSALARVKKKIDAFEG